MACNTATKTGCADQTDGQVIRRRGREEGRYEVLTDTKTVSGTKKRKYLQYMPLVRKQQVKDTNEGDINSDSSFEDRENFIL